MTEPKNSKLSPVSAADVHAAESALMSGRIERRDFMRIALLSGVGVSAASAMAGFAERAYANQLRLGAQQRGAEVGQRGVLGPGDAYYFESKTPHRFRNVGKTEAILVSANTPPSF